MQGDQKSSLYVFGRLRAGVGLDQARADMSTIQARLATTQLEEGGFGIKVETLREANKDPSLTRAAPVLQIAVIFVLVIACANAANLLLGRAVVRDQEMAVRTAMGASRWRLVCQTLTESMLLSCGAALIGLLLSVAGVRLLLAMAPPDVVRVARVAPTIATYFSLRL